MTEQAKSSESGTMETLAEDRAADSGAARLSHRRALSL